MKNIAELYSLTICLISTIVALVASILLITSIINITFFDLRNKDYLSRFNSNESYINSLHNSYDNERDKVSSLTTDKLTELRIQIKNDYIYSTKARQINDMIDRAVCLVVSLLFILIHVRIYKKSKSNSVV
jgi:hypothetical protein